MAQGWRDAVDRIIYRETRAITGNGWLEDQLRSAAVDSGPLEALLQPSEALERHGKRWLVQAHVREMTTRAVNGEETRAPTQAELAAYLSDRLCRRRDAVDLLLMAQATSGALALLAVPPPDRIMRLIERWRPRIGGMRVMQRQMDLVRLLRRADRRNPYWRRVLAA